MQRFTLGDKVQITQTNRVGIIDEIHEDGSVIVKTNGGESMPAKMEDLVAYE